MNHFPPIPYFQTSRYRVRAMVDLAEIKSNERAADLGSGDGRIVIALAQAGALVSGYETDEKLRKLSEASIKQAGIEEKARIYCEDFWQENLSGYDIVTVYPMPDVMHSLEEKLRSELRPGARVLLNYYPFLHWKEVIKKDSVYLYRR